MMKMKLSEQIRLLIYFVLCIQATLTNPQGTRDDDVDEEGHLIRDDRELFMEVADEWDSRWGSPYDYDKRDELLQEDLYKDKRYVDVDKRYVDVDRTGRDQKVPKVGELFEGDIVMDESLRSLVLGEDTKRDAVIDQKYLWPRGRVPYVLKGLDNDVLKSFYEAIQDYNTHTCIRFVPRVFETDYLYIFPNQSMCYSSVGRHGGKQKISLGLGCSRKGIIIHELMHSLGFVHEQSRPDRDKYVKIFKKNIKKGLEHNFDKFSGKLVTHLGSPYDYDSVLHYNNHAFSTNGKDTIQAVGDSDRRFGQREGFSKNDLRQINKLYNCEYELQNESLMNDVLYD
uniref:Metalloendopeptidase n=1 Tax=Pachycerianthus borealis TaxID=2736680 RepID=A0A7G7WYP3_9CNID|nr:toxin candidate TRINITY_DN22557_c0_g2_i1 [Pachycerianthus borealis]